MTRIDAGPPRPRLPDQPLGPRHSAAGRRRCRPRAIVHRIDGEVAIGRLLRGRAAIPIAVDEHHLDDGRQVQGLVARWDSGSDLA